MPLSIDGAAPDSWGRSVINANLEAVAPSSIHSCTCSSSGLRVSAIDFQASPTEYIPEHRCMLRSSSS